MRRMRNFDICGITLNNISQIVVSKEDDWTETPLTTFSADYYTLESAKEAIKNRFGAGDYVINLISGHDGYAKHTQIYRVSAPSPLPVKEQNIGTEDFSAGSITLYTGNSYTTGGSVTITGGPGGTSAISAYQDNKTQPASKEDLMISFSNNAQYLVLEGKFKNHVFSPQKISKCKKYAWIDEVTRIHAKHVDILNDKVRHDGKPFPILKKIPEHADVAKPLDFVKIRQLLLPIILILSCFVAGAAITKLTTPKEDIQSSPYTFRTRPH